MVNLLRASVDRPCMRDERGFTIVEVLVACFIAVVGLAGTLVLVDVTHLQTDTAKARTQGVSLQRELVEAARGVPYAELLPSTIVDRVQSQPGLADAQPGTPGWQVRRNGVTYTVSMGVCAVDDPRDGVGTTDPVLFCPRATGTASPTQCAQLMQLSGAVAIRNAAAGLGITAGECGLDLNADGRVDDLVAADVDVCGLGLCTSTPPATDANPEDYKRVIALVRWDRGTGTRHALQTAVIPNPGLSSGPAVTTLSGPAGTVGPGTSAVAFTATTNRTPAAMSWSLDGRAMGTASGSGTSWTFTWTLGSTVDGTYLVSAKATDAYGVFGATRTATVKLNRAAPAAVGGFAAGRNGSVVELEWVANPEGDLEGYRAYRTVSGGPDVEVCALTRQTSCQDTAPPDEPSIGYFVRAVDRDLQGALREGAASPTRTVTTTNQPPNPPLNLTASLSGGNVVLRWDPGVVSDPDLGDSVAFYRIYRDGTAYADRYARTGSGDERTFTDTRTGGQQHTYRVTAVDTQLAESELTPGVTR
jgi:hypothetical protein